MARMAYNGAARFRALYAITMHAVYRFQLTA